MGKDIKFSLVKKILSSLEGEWKKSFTFAGWYNTHIPEDHISYDETSDLEVFMETDQTWTVASVLYRDEKSLEGFNPGRKTVIILEEDLNPSGWLKQKLYTLRKSASGKAAPLEPSQNYLRQDSPEGWMELIQKTSPESMVNYVIKECEKSIDSGSFYCERDESGIKSIIIWAINSTHYFGHFWWNRGQDATALATIWNLHRYLEGTGITSFQTFCREDNIASLRCHEIIGYEIQERSLFLYSKG